MTTLDERIDADGIEIDSEAVGYKSDDDGWEHHAFTVTLTLDDRTMRTPFNLGMGIEGRPDVGMVLESLLSDASTYENADGFEDWARDLGFDPDSRKAEGIYKATAAQTEALREFLGDKYDAYLWETDHD